MSVYAKRARGLLCRYAATNNVQTADELKGFDLENYKFDARLSSDAKYVFGRTAAPEKGKKTKKKKATSTKTGAAASSSSSRPMKKRKTK